MVDQGTAMCFTTRHYTKCHDGRLVSCCAGPTRDFSCGAESSGTMYICGQFTTPWGTLWCESSAVGVRRVCFAAPPAPPVCGPLATALHAYLRGAPIPADLPVDLTSVPAFTQAVLHACRAIPFGETRSYAALAEAIGRPTAARAVGQALARNPVPVVIPCHRVVSATGALTGFLGGLAWKEALLAHERGILTP